MSLLLSLAAVVSISALVNVAGAQLAKLAKKTKTPVDDKIVALIRAHSPDIVTALEKLIKAQEAKKDAAPREQKRDHRDGK